MYTRNKCNITKSNVMKKFTLMIESEEIPSIVDTLNAWGNYMNTFFKFLHKKTEM